MSPARISIPDRIDHWIRRAPRHSVLLRKSSLSKDVRSAQDCPLSNRSVLKDQYEVLAPLIPPHLAALVKQLETQK
jgi:hypothetical protein